MSGRMMLRPLRPWWLAHWPGGLVCAVVAIGMKTHLKDMLDVGWKPIALMVIETVALVGLVYGLIQMG